MRAVSWAHTRPSGLPELTWGHRLREAPTAAIRVALFAHVGWCANLGVCAGTYITDYKYVKV